MAVRQECYENLVVSRSVLNVSFGGTLEQVLVISERGVGFQSGEYKNGFELVPPSDDVFQSYSLDIRRVVVFRGWIVFLFIRYHTKQRNQ